ncbi:hypothetical protein CsSME_00037723 [Camellia sinensis var. sinensis]
MELALSEVGLNAQMIAAIHDMLEFSEEPEKPQQHYQPSRAYFRDTKAMRVTTADILEYPNSYVFVVDMPGVKPDQIQVQLQDGNILMVSGERRREKEHKDDGVKYIKMERRLGKFMKRFELPENADTDSISAYYHDGVLTITVQKQPPPEPKKAKTIQIKVGSGGQAQAQAQDGGGSRESSGAQSDGTGETQGCQG